MSHEIVSIGQDTGYVFKGLVPGTFAFVPEECVSFDARHQPVVNNVAYVQSGWDIRNMRFNEAEDVGSRLFPEVRDDFADLGDERVNHFVTRMQDAYEALKLA
jgi:hypothetical protein